MVRPEKLANDAMTSRMSVSWNVTVIGGCCDCCACENNATGTAAGTGRRATRTGSGSCSGSTAGSSSCGSGVTTAAGLVVTSGCGGATRLGAAGAAAYCAVREVDQLDEATLPPEMATLTSPSPRFTSYG